ASRLRRAQVVADQSWCGAADGAAVLADVEQAAAEDRHAPALAVGQEEAGNRQLMVAFRVQIQPDEVPVLAEHQAASVHPEQRRQPGRDRHLSWSSGAGDDLLPPRLVPPHLLAGLERDADERRVLRAVAVDAVEIAVFA